MSVEDSIKSLVVEYFNPLINSGGRPSSTKAPGGICGVFYDGEEYYHPRGNVGTVQNAEVPSKNTVFGLGSVTKTLTTSVLGQQPCNVLAGPAHNLGLPIGYTLTPDERRVTLAQLATFTGGFPTVLPKGKDWNQAQFQKFINKLAPPRLPAPNRYSDSSIGFLAQVLMGADGYTSFGASETTQWLKDKLLSALSMNRTSGDLSSITDKQHPRATPYELDCTEQPPQYTEVEYLPWVPWGAAGRFYSTCADMLKFVQANVGRPETLPQKILDGMKLAQLQWAPSQSGKLWIKQGFAWDIFDFDIDDQSTLVSGKDGDVPGVSSYVTVCPSRKLGVVFLTNLQGPKPRDPALGLTRGLLEL